MEQKKIKWWQKIVRGWTVPFWYTDTPLVSKRVSEMLANKSISKLIIKSKNKQS